jgi:hypothetical protein
MKQFGFIETKPYDEGAEIEYKMLEELNTLVNPHKAFRNGLGHLFCNFRISQVITKMVTSPEAQRISVGNCDISLCMNIHKDAEYPNLGDYEFQSLKEKGKITNIKKGFLTLESGHGQIWHGLITSLSDRKLRRFWRITLEFPSEI